MKIVLATSNQGKVREIREAFHEREIIAYTDVIKGFEIVEDGATFKANALKNFCNFGYSLGEQMHMSYFWFNSGDCWVKPLPSIFLE